jgi:hypothetical protein
MKRFRQIFFLVIFLLFMNHLHAQKFDAGILAGLSTSQVDGDDLSGFNKAGFKAGGFVSRKLGGKAALVFEIEYIQKGSRKPVSADNEYFLMRLGYIEVPLLFNYYVGKKWNLEAGVAFAALVSSYEEDETGEILHAPEFNRLDYLIAIGANYFITSNFYFNIRYSYSIVPMRGKTENYNYRYFIGGQYNEVLAFTMGYVF